MAVSKHLIDINIAGAVIATSLDINGAADIAGALVVSAGALSITGDGSNAVTFTESSAGIMTIAAPDDIILDANSDIILDANGADIRLKDSGSEFAKFTNSSNDFHVACSTQDKDILFRGMDGNTTLFTALTLVMADAGAAIFNSTIASGKITTTVASEHVSGNITAATAHLDLYNNWESNTDQKGSIITFTDNYYDGSNYHKTTRAAIKGGTDTVGNTADGYLELYTDSGGANSPTLALRLDKDQNAAFAGNVTAGSNSLTAGSLDINGNADISGDLTLSAGADGALTFGAASSIKIVDNNAAALVFEEANTAYMTFVTTNSSEAVKFDKPLDINATMDIDGAIQLDAAFTSGVDGQGYDTKFFGDTSGKYMLWDTSADALTIVGALRATTKSFVIDTPDGGTLEYGSLEGRSHDVFHKGKCNSNIIELPKEWEWLIDESTVTVQLTSIGKHQNLYVKEVKDNKVYISAGMFKTPNCYFLIHASRKDTEQIKHDN